MTSPLQSSRVQLAIVRLPILIVLVALGTKAVVETDIWGHMRFGLDLIATHALPVVDRYSFTSTPPWVNHEWASDLLFAFAYKTGGLPLLALLRALSLCFALFVLDRGLRDVTWPLRDLLIAAVVLVSLPLLGAVRPQIVSVPLYALTLVGLAKDAVWLPIVFAIWANLHGGWLLGMGAVGVRAFVSPTRRRMLLLIACGIATLTTPYGFNLWRSLAEAIWRGWGDVVEWQPIWSVSVGPRGAITWSILAAVVIWAAYSKLPASKWEWAWTIGAGLAAARARRHIPFFAITIALLLLQHVRIKGAAISTQKLTPLAAGIFAIPIVAAMAVAGSVLRPTLSCLTPADPPVRPEPGAVKFIQGADLRGRVLMWFDWGLYAVWQVGDRLQVSFDNRRETVYSASTVADHLRFYDGDDPDYPDRIRADYVWLPPHLKPLSQLTARGWHLIYLGRRSAILSRQNQPLTVDTTLPASSCFPEP